MPKFKSVDENVQESSGGGGPLAGPFLVKPGSVFRVVQPRAFGDREAGAPHTAEVLSLVPLDEDGDEIADADVREVTFGLGSKSLGTFHPGTADSPDDEDPEDAGDEVNSEGPTIYTDNASAEIHQSTGYWVFRNSLIKAGFKKELIEQSWAPHLDGMKFILASVTSDKLEQYGSKSDTRPPKPGDRPITYKVVEKIISYPYDTKKGKTSGKAAPAKAEKSAPATNGSSGDAQSEFEKVVAYLASKFSGKEMELKRFASQWLANYSGAKADVKLQVEAKKLANDEAAVIEALSAQGADIDLESGKIKFA